MRRPGVLAAVIAVVCALVTGCDPGVGPLHLRIAAGNPGGVYLPLARPLAAAWAADLEIALPEVQETQGSLDNLARLRSGQADIAFVAADVAADQPTGIAALARIHDDYLHVVVRADSSITAIEQLKEHRVAIGAPDSGVEYIAHRLLTIAGLSGRVTTRQLGFQDSLTALTRGEIDAFFWSGGLPTVRLAEAAGSTRVRLLDLEDFIPRMREISPVYGTATIPASTYHQEKPVTTLLVPNFL
ncbi:MAG TPA: TAXI family TRAP transporter solute-binding subunit, partial [Amycolatopsis sp.]|nr:TAXI family TRAP transporter solute-binding subunit [Amycolatopsis sp.]